MSTGGSAAAISTPVKDSCLLGGSATYNCPKYSAQRDGWVDSIYLADFFYRLLNFVIMVAVLVFIFKKFNLKGYFTKRTETISNTLRDLEEKKKEAEKTYEEYNRKLARLDEETDRILKEYVEQGEREKAKIIANAEKAAAEIRKQTDIAIEQEIKSAKEGLQREIAELSVTAAEALLKEKIGDTDQKKLVDDFMTKVVEAK